MQMPRFVYILISFRPMRYSRSHFHLSCIHRYNIFIRCSNVENVRLIRVAQCGRDHMALFIFVLVEKKTVFIYR